MALLCAPLGSVSLLLLRLGGAHSLCEVFANVSCLMGWEDRPHPAAFRLQHPSGIFLSKETHNSQCLSL